MERNGRRGQGRAAGAEGRGEGGKGNGEGSEGTGEGEGGKENKDLPPTVFGLKVALVSILQFR